MMKKNLFLLFSLAVALIMTSCDAGVDPVKYNDSLVKYSNVADKRLDDFAQKLDSAIETEDEAEYAKLVQEAAQVATDSLKADIDRANALQKPSNSDDFHNATIAYMESLVEYVKVASDEYAKITANTTDKELNAIEEKADKAEEATQPKLDSMIAAQKAFAKAHNMILTDN